MIVGSVGLLASMLFWSSFSPYAGGRGRHEVRVRDRGLTSFTSSFPRNWRKPPYGAAFCRTGRSWRRRRSLMR